MCKVWVVGQFEIWDDVSLPAGGSYGWLKECLRANGDAVLEQMKATHREDQERLDEIMTREALAPR